MEEQEKNELDTRITGDLTSNHHQIMDLEKQFKEILGYVIPCRESYLHSMPYRLMVNDSGYTTEINVVAPSPLLPLLSPKTETPHTKGSYFAEVHSSPTNNCRSGVISKKSKQSQVPNYIENRLKEIIKEHPEGLHCNRLPDLYKDHFGQDLNIFNYGYKSVAHLCIDLSSIFTYQTLSDSSVKVFDKDLEVEVHHEPIQSVKMVRDRPSRNTELALPDGVEDTLLDFHLEHLAQDVAADIGIIRQWIGPEIEVESYINIVVGEVYDPSKFWIQLWECWHSLNQLMDRMQVFYRNNKGKYSIPCYAIKEGMYLACILDGEYHRARVIDDRKKKDGTLKVYCIDYGTVAVIQTQGVCYLVQDFVKLPAQAIRARLWGIQPTVRDMPWPSATSLRFFEVVRSKVLVGQVYAVDEEVCLFGCFEC